MRIHFSVYLDKCFLSLDINISIKAEDTTVSTHAMPVGLWLQHVHAQTQNFFFAPGSFTHSFPTIALTTLAFMRQRRALQCVSLSMDFDKAWTKVGPDAFLLWYKPNLMYIERTDKQIYCFSHKRFADHTFLCGQLCTSLGNMSTQMSDLEPLLFSWLSPREVTLNENTRKWSGKLVQEDLQHEQWNPDIFFIEINKANKAGGKEVHVKMLEKDKKNVPGILRREEWTCAGRLELYVLPRASPQAS